MIASPEVMDGLKAIGLNKYERNLWVALLSKVTASAGELAEISNVPRSRCYDVLETLADKGFVVLQAGKPMKYVAVEPDEAFERAKNKEMKEAKQMCEKIDKMKKSSVAEELNNIHEQSLKTSSPEEMSGTLKGRDVMHQQLDTMLKNAKHQVKLLTTSDGLEELGSHHSNVIKKTAGNGVNVQVIAPINESNREIAKMLSAHADIRNIGNVERAEEKMGRISLVDDKESMISLTHDEDTHETQDMHFWSKSPHAAGQIFGPIFDKIWADAEQFT